MNKKISGFAVIFTATVAFSLFSSPSAFAQDDYEDWKKAQEAEYQEYKDKFDQEFIELLEKTWEEVGIEDGSSFYKERKPVEIPSAPPRPEVKNNLPKDNPPIKENITVDIPDYEDPEPIRIEIPADKSIFEGIATQKASINYFTSSIPFEYPTKLRDFFSTNEFVSGKTDNKKIAKFWDKVSSIDHTPLIEYSEQIRRDFKLNDWGYVLLLNNFTRTIFAAYDHKLISLYNWFLLTKAGYDVRVGYDQNGVYTLFSVQNNVFNTMYYTLDGNKFYVIDINEHKQNPSSIFTYSGKHKAQTKKLDLRINEFPNLGDTKSKEERTLSFSYGGDSYSIPLSIDKNLINYFEHFPLTELPIFFKAPLSDQSRSAIYKVLAPVVSEMDEQQAVNFILRFVQTAFDYKTDQDQFDREKYMVPEETLFYPYSDCDDRAILFASLVSDLLEMEVVGLRYSQHLATAVHFRGNVEGDAHHHMGKKYIVADPTYINADVGMTMKQYKNEKPEIVSF